MKTNFLTLFLFFLTANVIAQDWNWAYVINGTIGNHTDDVEIDPFGNIWLVGGFNNTIDVDPGPGVYNLYNNNTDSYITKLNSAGNFLWSGQLTGIDSENIDDIVSDSQGNIYLVGNYNYTADLNPGPASLNVTTMDEDDGFILKLNSFGSLLWAKQIRGAGDQRVTSIDIDSQGSILITGIFEDSADFDPGPGVFQMNSSSNELRDMFISKLDANGDFIWAKSFGGISFENAEHIKVDHNDNFFLTGSVSDSVDLDPGIGVDMYYSQSDLDYFISKFDTDGNYLWGHASGGISVDSGECIAVDSDNNVYVTVRFQYQIEVDPGPDTLMMYSYGLMDGFIHKLDENGNLIWVYGVQGSSWDACDRIVIDDMDQIFVSGEYSHTLDFDLGPAVNLAPTALGQMDVFLMKIDTERRLCWLRTFGGSNQDFSRGLDVSIDGKIALTGSLKGTVDFDPGAGVYSLSGTNLTQNAYLTSFTDLNSCEVDTSITINNNVLTAGQVNAAYQWIDCSEGTIIPGEVGVSFVAPTDNIYAAIVTKGCCVDTTSCVRPDFSSLDEHKPSFKLYPNPTDGELNIVSNNLIASTIGIKLLDFRGRIVDEKMIFNSTNITLNVSQYDAGIYWVQIKCDDKIQMYRFIIR